MWVQLPALSCLAYKADVNGCDRVCECERNVRVCECERDNEPCVRAPRSLPGQPYALHETAVPLPHK